MKDLWNRIVNFLFRERAETTSKEIDDNEQYIFNYKEKRRINFTAIFSNKFAKYTTSQSKVSIKENNKRAEYLNNHLSKLWRRKKRKIANIAFGTGGAFLVPYVQKQKLYYKILEQNRVSINKVDGELITSATILAETKIIKTAFSTKKYIRWSNYSVEDNVLIIEQKYTDEDGEEITCPDFWNNITPIIKIKNVDRVLLGFIKSPTENRESDEKYGVPITYGCGDTINEIYECLEQIKREFKLKETFVGADFTLFKDENTLSEKGLYRKVNGSKGDFWEIFDPAIRDSSYFARLQELYARLESEIGTSRGILTKAESNDVTATETKRNMFDSFTIVDDMRTNIEDGLEDYIYSCNVLCDVYKLCPQGEYEMKYDWDYSLIENSQETFNQLNQGVSRGAVKTSELRQYIYPNETSEESEKAIKEIKKQRPNIKDLIGTEDE